MIVRREYWEEEKMKKLLTLLLSLLMIVSLAGCAKKKSVTVKVTDQGGNNFVVATETDAKNLKELLRAGVSNIDEAKSKHNKFPSKLICSINKITYKF